MWLPMNIIPGKIIEKYNLCNKEKKDGKVYIEIQNGSTGYHRQES